MRGADEVPVHWRAKAISFSLHVYVLCTCGLMGIGCCGVQVHVCIGDQPANISTKSDPAIEMKGTLASPATALASRVFPVPGGPYKRAPWGEEEDNGETGRGRGGGRDERK